MDVQKFGPLCLKVTFLTVQNNVTVLGCYVSPQAALCCSLVLTLTTGISLAFVLRLDMNLQTTLCATEIITMIT